ncbi:MAG: OmpH family outer membrane protein [Ignavibacteriota bacterium]|nr:OmpH family outer membrane protein [Ignavibacteriota bacterium]MBW7841783.1 OmpH family outer membrane protein [Ignavibacterium sp.]MCO6446630.1 OmpH family outer membrane protein [Ignavibacterium album]MCZ2269147.1 OmpH family outer membrane protein [Ignavibacteriales bacterium]HMN17640.1 OmpH family outer membrane protein [Ignavibacteriaceae bacterium]
MKKILITSIFILVSSISFAQLKIGYIDSDTIMDQLPDVQDARQKLDALIQEWQAELNKMENDWKTKYDDYEKRKLIMSDQTRAETEAALVQLETQMAQYREKKFGTNGELFQKQDELMKPVQNKIFAALKELAEQEDFDFVFDRSGDIMILFAKEKYDLTSKVLDKLKLK